MTTSERAPRGPATRDNLGVLERRALAIWPRLDASALRRCRHDPHRIAALVARRTTMPPEAIVSVLTMPAVAEDEIDTWFG